MAGKHPVSGCFWSLLTGHGIRLAFVFAGAKNDTSPCTKSAIAHPCTKKAAGGERCGLGKTELQDRLTFDRTAPHPAGRSGQSVVGRFTEGQDVHVVDPAL
jgi:hypothetical protein